jgi:pectin methylesterase-like acyl-CoA thioesterase
MTAFVLLLALAPAQAREFHVVHDVSVDAARSALVGQSFVVNSIYRDTDGIVIDVPAAESRDPRPVVLALQTRAAQRQAMLDELETIEAAIDAGTETAAQRRRFMKILLKLSGWSRRP